MGGILLWLAEAIGGAVLKGIIARWLERRQRPAPEQAITAEASVADAKAARAAQDAANTEARAKVDQQVMAKGADAARADMAAHWNEP